MTKHILYKIYWPGRRLFYFGKTKGFRKRRNRHLRELKDGTHHNIKLILGYEKYGVPDIKIVGYAVCDDTLATLEKSYLQKYKLNKNCCNIQH